jgi:hypothetical protein
MCRIFMEFIHRTAGTVCPQTVVEFSPEGKQQISVKLRPKSLDYLDSPVI